MVRITEEATSTLNDLRNEALSQAQGLPENIPAPGLRLLIEEQEVSLALDVPRAEDQVVERDGHPVLLIGHEVGTLLDGLTVDVEHATSGDRLIIENREEETPDDGQSSEPRG